MVMLILTICIICHRQITNVKEAKEDQHDIAFQSKAELPQTRYRHTLIALVIRDDDSMTMIYELELKIQDSEDVLHTKNVLSRSKLSKVTTLQTQRQTGAT